MNAEFQDWRRRLIDKGQINPIGIGMVRNEIVRKFGRPSDFGAFKKKIPQILKYSEIEFHFDIKNKDKLILIYSEELDISIK